jgi:hypothetical protein
MLKMETLSARFVDEAESKRLGIVHGWYGVRVSGTLMTASCSTREECLEAISHLPKPATIPSVLANDGQVGQVLRAPGKSGSLFGSIRPVSPTLYDIARKPSRRR